MFRLKHKQKIQVVFVILACALVVYASVTGPEARYTGAPGDINNCVQCHDTFEQANVGPGSVRLDGVPSVYTPGQQYNLTVVAQQSGRRHFGFQLTVIDIDGNRIGTLAAVSADARINPTTGAGDRQYIQHAEGGTQGQSTRVWAVRWTAPSTDLGTARFYLAGNAANGNGTNQGDYIYTASVFSESPTTVVNLALESDPVGQALLPGTTYTISWTATNPSNIDNIELRYSTNDGSTYPINNLIFSTRNASITTFDWTVPDISVSQARLRITGGTKSGAAIASVTSGRFSIAGTGVARPRIDSVEIDGKKLYVFGENFQEGAKVELNEEDQKTSNEDEAGRELKCKKAGKKIAPGQTVTLVVRNPDDSRSDVFTYRRPD